MPSAINLREINPDVLYPPKEAGGLLHRSEKTLANHRSERRGCAVTYIGRAPFYKGSDLLAYLGKGRVDFEAKPAIKPQRRAAA